MFAFQIKRMMKDPVIWILLILYGIYFSFVAKYTMVGNAEDGFILSMSQVEVLFLLFLSITFYQCSNDKRKGAMEVVESHPGGRVKYYLSRILILSIVAFVITAIFTAISILSLQKAQVIDLRPWLKIVFHNLWINQFLVYEFAILLGILVSQVKDAVTGIIIIVFVYFGFSHLFMGILSNLLLYHEKLLRLLSILGINARLYNVSLDGYYMYSIGSYDYERMLCCLFAAISLLCARIVDSKRIKVALTSASAILSVIFACLYVRPYGFNYTDWFGSAQRIDQEYYQGPRSKELGADHRVEEAGFTIKKISGTITIGRTLGATIKIQLEENTRKDYKFTLYHGYELSRVLSEGRPLPFERSGDHICIHSTKPLDELVFKYSGYSENYCTDEQTTFLPGYFAYIPFSGYRKIWYDDEDGERLPDGTIFMGKFINYDGMGYKVDYDLNLQCKNEIHTNLTRTENGRYVGETEGVSIVSSEFLHETKVEDVTIIYSSQLMDNMSENLVKDYALECIHSFKYKEELRGKTIIIPRFSGDNTYYVASDHIMCPLEDLDDLYGNYLETGEYPYEKPEDLSSDSEEEMEDSQ